MLFRGRFVLYSCYLGVDKDASAVFANYDFFVHLDFELFLRWDAVETAAARIALDVDNTKAVAGVFADALESVESIGVDFRFEILCLLAEAILVLTGFRNDFFKFCRAPFPE